MTAAEFGPVERAIVKVIQGCGYAVRIEELAGRRLLAEAAKGGERHVAEGDEPQRVLCELALKVGIELDDG